MKTTDAVEILRRRSGVLEPHRCLSLASERVNCDVAQLIYDARTHAGFTQRELAKQIGTTQSVLSRLESASYHSHSLSLLKRIAEVLSLELVITLRPLGDGGE